MSQLILLTQHTIDIPIIARIIVQLDIKMPIIMVYIVFAAKIRDIISIKVVVLTVICFKILQLKIIAFIAIIMEVLSIIQMVDRAYYVQLKLTLMVLLPHQAVAVFKV